MHPSLLSYLDAMAFSQARALHPLSISDSALLNQREQHSLKGHYDPQLLYSDRDVEPYSIGEFLRGPVHISFQSGGSGCRGVFATRDIVPGELLMVTRAVGIGSSKESLLESALDRMITSNLVAMRVGALAGHSMQGKKALPRKLPEGFYIAEEGFEWETSVEDAVRDIITVNSFAVDQPWQEKGQSMRSLALHPEGSFFNHACRPNCTFFAVREMLFVRSVRRILQGEEATLSYFPWLLPWHQRSAMAQERYGFRLGAVATAEHEKNSDDAIEMCQRALSRGEPILEVLEEYASRSPAVQFELEMARGVQMVLDGKESSSTSSFHRAFVVATRHSPPSSQTCALALAVLCSAFLTDKIPPDDEKSVQLEEQCQLVYGCGARDIPFFADVLQQSYRGDTLGLHRIIQL